MTPEPNCPKCGHPANEHHGGVCVVRRDPPLKTRTGTLYVCNCAETEGAIYRHALIEMQAERDRQYAEWNKTTLDMLRFRDERDEALRYGRSADSVIADLRDQLAAYHLFPIDALMDEGIHQARRIITSAAGYRFGDDLVPFDEHFKALALDAIAALSSPERGAKGWQDSEKVKALYRIQIGLINDLTRATGGGQIITEDSDLDALCSAVAEAVSVPPEAAREGEVAEGTLSVNADAIEVRKRFDVLMERMDEFYPEQGMWDAQVVACYLVQEARFHVDVLRALCGEAAQCTFEVDSDAARELTVRLNQAWCGEDPVGAASQGEADRGGEAVGEVEALDYLAAEFHIWECENDALKRAKMLLPILRRCLESPKENAALRREIGQVNDKLRTLEAARSAGEGTPLPDAGRWVTVKFVEGDADFFCCGVKHHLYFNGGELDQTTCKTCGTKWRTGATGYVLQRHALLNPKPEAE